MNAVKRTFAVAATLLLASLTSCEPAQQAASKPVAEPLRQRDRLMTQLEGQKAAAREREAAFESAIEAGK